MNSEVYTDAATVHKYSNFNHTTFQSLQQENFAFIAQIPKIAMFDLNRIKEHHVSDQMSIHLEFFHV